MKHTATEAEKKAVLDAVFTPLGPANEASFAAPLVRAQFEMLYFWLFRHARNPVARWAWRKTAGTLTALKHFERGNQTEGWRWVRWTCAP